MRGFLIVFISLLLTGCYGQPSTPPAHNSRVVIAIDITQTRDGQLQQYRCTDQQEMAAILKSLQKMNTGRRVDIDPETFRGEVCKIQLTMTDGAHRLYYLLSGHYLQGSNGIWRKVDKGEAEFFMGLVHTLCGVRT